MLNWPSFNQSVGRFTELVSRTLAAGPQHHWLLCQYPGNRQFSVSKQSMPRPLVWPQHHQLLCQCPSNQRMGGGCKPGVAWCWHLRRGCAENSRLGSIYYNSISIYPLTCCPFLAFFFVFCGLYSLLGRFTGYYCPWNWKWGKMQNIELATEHGQRVNLPWGYLFRNCLRGIVHRLKKFRKKILPAYHTDFLSHGRNYPMCSHQQFFFF